MKKSLLLILIGALIAQSGCFTAFSDNEKKNEKKVDLENQLIVLLGLEDSTGAPSVSITNFRDDSEIKSGFVIGTASGPNGIDRVEVSLDGGDFQAADGTEEWKYQLPTTVNIWKIGTEHTISVRSVAAGEVFSEVASITVRKGHNSDLNGDGYPDMVVSAPGHSTKKGRVYIYYGRPQGPESDASLTLTGANNNDLFGISIALGDVNGDGYTDLFVGANGYNSKQGRLYVYNGSASGVVTTAAHTIDGEAANNDFSGSMTIGDVNGDGYADVAVGSPSYNSGDGRAYLHHGGSSGLSGTASRTITGAPGSVGRFGGKLVLGDVNGDGYADLAVSAAATTNGTVFVHHGSSAGISASASNTMEGEASGDAFGFCLAMGDVTGNGYADLVIGAPYRESLTGSAYLYAGSDSGINGDAYTRRLDGESEMNAFGGSLTLGDVNGDGYLDLAASSIAYENLTGRVYVHHGKSGDVDTTPSRILTGANEYDTFGHTLSIGFINGDGYADLVVGIPGYSSYTGMAQIHNGSDSGTAGSSSLDLFGEGVNNNFGWAIALGNAEIDNWFVF